jgi:GntR family transcriptional regulator of gluconate operon
LAGEGLIAPAGRSYRVVGLDEKDLHDLFALREILEVSAAQRCASVDPSGFRAAAEAALERMHEAAESGDAEAFAAADVDFHSAFFAFCGNQRLHAVWEQQVPTFSELFRLTTALDQPLLSTVESHRAVMDTIREGNLEAISAGVRDLVVGGEQQIVSTQKALREVRSA